MAKKIKTSSYKIGHLIDQSGGMNNAVYPALLNDNEAKLLKNATLDEKGTVKTCKGRRERFAEAFSTDPVNGITAFYPDTATSRLVFGSGTKLYKDTPHLVNSYDSKADWDSGSKSSFCETSDEGLSVEEAVLEYGITDTGSLSTAYSSDYEYGWRFTVGAQDIVVDKLRYYCPAGGYSRTLRLWRHSDQTKLAEVTITTEKDKWVEGEITPQILKAGEKYTVSFGYPGASQYRYFISNPTYGKGITFDAMVLHGTPGSYPASAITYVYGIVDFAYYATLDKTIQEDWANGESENIEIDSDDIKLTKTDEVYAETGTWTGTAFDIIDIDPDTSKIEWIEDTPEGTTVTVETRGGYDGVNWGDWTAQTSGEAVSTLNLYNQVRVVMTSDGTATPTVSNLVLTVTAKSARAIWTSPIIDASNATDINASQAIMEYTGTAEVQSRSSADEGETWGAWVTADADGNLNHTPNNHIQVRIIYLNTVQSLQVSLDEAPVATELATGFTAGSQFYFTTLLSKLIITNKLNAPRKWDGTDAVATLGGSPPHGQYTATHKNYVFMAHTAENPSRIYWSDLLDLETWGALSYIDISPNDGDWITGLLPFSDYLIITKQRSVWVLVGDGPSSFEVRRIHEGIGCIAPRSLVKMEGVFSFVGTEGIYLSDLNMPIVITERLKKTWDELNKRRLTQAASTYYDHKLRIDLPSSGSTRNDIRIIYDNIRKALYLQEFKKHASCYATFIEAGQEILLYGHSTEGQVSRADFGTTDAGEPITMDWETKWFNFGSSAVEKKVRRLYLVCVPANSDTELKVYLVVDGVEDGEPLSVMIPGSPNNDEITVRLNPKDIDVRKIRTLGYRITQSTTNGGVQFHELLQEFRAKKVKAT